MKKVRWLYLLGLLLFNSVYSAPIHKDFVQNFTKDNISDDSRPHLVTAMAYSNKGNVLLIGRESGYIDIWDATQARRKLEIKAHTIRTNQLAFTLDGNAFFSSSSLEGNTKLWSTKTGGLLSLITDARGPVSGTSNNNFYVIANNEELHIYDFKNRILMREKYRFSPDVVTTIKYDQSTDQIAIGTASGTILILKFSMNNGKPTIEKVSSASPYHVGNWVIGLSFADNGRTLYSVARRGSVDEWSIQPLKIRRSLPSAMKSIDSLVFMGDKGALAMIGRGENVYPSVSPSFMEIISLANGNIENNSLNTDYPWVIEYLSSHGSVIAAHPGSIDLYTLPSDK